MKPGSATDEAKFTRFLEEGAEKLGIAVSEDGLSRLLVHRRILLKWSRRMNLTTVFDPQGMAERLYLDSLVLLPHLSGEAGLHDVGSGAGFPGLVVKAVCPDLAVVLTEARRKKVSFLRQAAREMGLSEGLSFFCLRLGHDPVAGGEGWGEVVSRAAFPPAEWIRQGSPLVARGGRLWIFSGQPVGDFQELEADLAGLLGDLPAGFSLADRVAYRLPWTGKDRLLVSLRRDL